MDEDNSVKIMKLMWENYDRARTTYHGLLLSMFLVTILQAVLIMGKYRAGIMPNTFDFMGGLSMIIMLAFAYFLNVKYKKRREEVHNLYLEMVQSVKKE